MIYIQNTVEITASAGESISRASEKAIELCQQYSCYANLTFNGVSIHIDSCSNAADRVRLYEEKIKRL